MSRASLRKRSVVQDQVRQSPPGHSYVVEFNLGAAGYIDSGVERFDESLTWAFPFVSGD